MRNMLVRFVAENANPASRGAVCGDDLWRDLAELGILGLRLPEEYGGSGGNPFDTILVMEALGSGLVSLPYVPTVVIAGGLLLAGGSGEQRRRLLPGIAEGKVRIAFAGYEPQSRFNPACVSTRAVADDDGFVLTGHKAVVYGAPEADWLLVVARTAGEMGAENGISLFLVEAGAPGVAIRGYDTVEGMRAGDIRLEDVRVSRADLVGREDGAFELIEAALDEAVVALSADAVGAMDAVIRRTVEYCETREAFGQKLAEFQVLRHRVVDMHIALEIAAAALLNAATALTADRTTRRRLVSACKVQVASEANFVGKNAVQLHGAIGMTDELDVGQYFKRLTVFQASYGGTDWHLRRFLAHSQA